MLSLKELTDRLSKLLPSNGLTDYCINGLQVQGKDTIKTLATAVSASLETIKVAGELGVDALIVHHGIFWNHDKQGVLGVQRDKIYELLKNGISLFAYHLPLDMHPLLGNNWKAALDMGWTNLEPFGYLNGAQIGVKGFISPMSQKQVQKKLEDYYGHPAACALGGKETIETLALISGGAYRSLTEAVKEGIDGFITGNFDEPVWHQAFEEKINFFALGHSATERVGPLAVAKYIELEWQIPCHFIDIPNPF